MKMSEGNKYVVPVVAALVVLAGFLLLTNPSLSGLAVSNVTALNGTATFTVDANLVLDITDDTINLGTVQVSDTKNSEDAGDWFTVENNGSVNMDVSAFAGADPFAGTSTFPGSNYQIHANSTESGTPTTAYANIPASAGTAVLLIDELQPGTSVDSAQIGVQVTVPADETAGLKTGVITLIAEDD